MHLAFFFNPLFSFAGNFLYCNLIDFNSIMETKTAQTIKCLMQAFLYYCNSPPSLKLYSKPDNIFIDHSISALSILQSAVINTSASCARYKSIDQCFLDEVF